MSGTPPAEVHIDAALVRGLLADQHPDLAGLPLNAIDAGWDNQMFRLGDRLAVRLPRRALAAALVIHEQDWLPGLAPHLPIPTPAPLRAGAPGRGYPWRWSVLPWFEGAPASDAPPRPDQAPRMANFLTALHQEPPANAPINPVRGEALDRRAPDVEARLERLSHATEMITPAVMRAWRAGLTAPASTTPKWIHGDLHARNILVREGAICAVIDWGDITSGDVATDLAVAWHLFDDRAARAAFFARYGATGNQIARAMAWAVRIGAILLETGLADHPVHAAMGEAVLRRISADGQSIP